MNPAAAGPSRIRRWLPHPLMSAFLLLAWLLLQRSLAPGTLLAGVLLALGLGWAFGKLRPPAARVRNLPLLVRLLLRVVVDIVRSNLAVARIVLRPRGQVRSGFVSIPLELTDPYGLAVLACIITSTPGTIWVDHDSARRVLLIHVLDLVDEAAWIGDIKHRYERPLLEIFQ
ncbi:Na+/H+ antiporter subunit E [Frateuria sp. YIM B11624]|uniref:Na+/H+ antiporter subunit E n=1 Tax=Frateuria sp. YIM B11624 TaxID=3143185 RepID=UPI003C75DDD7